MRKHGWQLPHHPLQVVAVTVFLALGFAFYVFFVPFVGRKMFQYVVMGIYTPLITGVFCLYIWCAAANPCDPGVFKSNKYLSIVDSGKHSKVRESKLGGESISSTDANAPKVGVKPLDEGMVGMNAIGEDHTSETEKKNACFQHSSSCMVFLGWCPCPLIHNSSRQHEESSEQQMSEGGMFYCTLCKVEVFKYSKHCRVCDKCVDHFDHHCRWLNNCIGKKNYRQFFALMVSALFLLVLQWSIGILVMICCFLDRKRFNVEITSNLGSRFSLAPFVVVVASCTILAMISTLPLAQLFFFHVLLIKKGLGTYDYIIALREQEQQGVAGQQSPQMSLSSSLTGLSSASSFNTLHRGAWCTPPRLFLEDQFDVVPPDIGMSMNSSGKRMLGEEPVGKKNTGAVKISPWTLARLNAEEVSKVAAQARKKSKVLQPVVRREVPIGLEKDGISCRMDPRPENRRHQPFRLPTDLTLEHLAKMSVEAGNNRGNLLAETSISLAPLQLEARSAFNTSPFNTSRAMSASATIVDSSPDSSIDSFNPHPFRISSSGAEEARVLVALSAAQKGIPLSRSNSSDGYEASGGEDSDRVPSRMYRSTAWSNLVFSSDHDHRMVKSNASSSSSQANNGRL